MPEFSRVNAVGAAIAVLRKVRAPRERLRAIHLVREELTRRDGALDQLLGETLLELRADTPPATWAELGSILEVTPQRAHQLAAEYIGHRQKGIQR